MQNKIYFIAFAIFIFNHLNGQVIKVDSTFGINGEVVCDILDTALNPFGSNMDIQPDGKIVVAGSVFDYLGLKRYNTDGSLDLTFETDNLAVTTSVWGMLCAVAIQNDSKIVAVSNGYNFNKRVIRFNNNGQIDTTFGINGRVTIDYQSRYTNQLKLQTDGKILVYGGEEVDALDFKYFVCRLNPDGTLDSSFADNGIFIKDYEWVDFLWASAFQSDGKPVFLGTSSTDGSDWKISLMRLDQTGKLDSTFGTNGAVFYPLIAHSEAFGMVAQPDDKIVITGNTSDTSDVYTAIVARYNPDGSPDITFGDGGVRYIPEAPSGYDIVLRSNGKILMTGSLENDSLVLIQLMPDGQNDESFGNSGMFVSPLKMQPRTLKLFGNQIIVSGRNTAFPQDYILHRYISDLNVGTIGSGGEQQENETLIYPNPISDVFTLEFALLQDEAVNIDLFDMGGKLVQSLVSAASFERGAHKETYQCPGNLPAGFYLLQVSTKNKNTGVIIEKR